MAKDDPVEYVSTATCLARTEQIRREVVGCSERIKALTEAMIGEDMQGGVVGKLNEMRRQLESLESKIEEIKRPRLSGRDKVLLFAAFFSSASAVIIEIIRSLKL